MISFSRFLPRPLLILVNILALLFGLAMLHPYPRQSLFGPTIRGKPWCVWEDAVRHFVHIQFHDEVIDQTLSAKVRHWLGIKHQGMGWTELFDDAEMVPLLLELAEDTDPAVRAAAFHAICNTDKLRHASALPLMRRRLHDDDEENRTNAARALWLLDKDKQVFPVLLRQLADRQYVYRVDAMQLLSGMSAEAPELYPTFVAYATDPDERVRSPVMQAMRHFGKKGLPILLEGLNDTHADVRRAAVNALAGIGPDAKEAIPALERRLNDSDKKVREAVAAALRAIVPEHGPHLRRDNK